MRQSDLARRADERVKGDRKVTRDMVNQYVHGRNLPTPIIMEALADALGMEAKDLAPSGEVFRPVSAGPIPEKSVTDDGFGNARLMLNTIVDWKTAVEILALVDAGEEKAAEGK